MTVAPDDDIFASMMLQKKCLACIAILIFIFLSGKGLSAPLKSCGDKTLPTKTLLWKETPFVVSIAKAEQDRVCGLSNRVGLEAGEGMFFVFDNPAFHGMWMKDMRFPIDIIWLDENLRVLTVFHDVSPQTYPRVFYPQQKASYVLEIIAGTAKNYGMETSRRFQWKNRRNSRSALDDNPADD